MKDYPFLWLLVYTKTGRVILGLVAIYVFIRLAEWWAIPITTGFGGYLMLEVYSKNKNTMDKKWSVIGICLLVAALISAVVVYLLGDE